MAGRNEEELPTDKAQRGTVVECRVGYFTLGLAS